MNLNKIFSGLMSSGVAGGVAGGAVLGALIHKDISMSDEDKQALEQNRFCLYAKLISK